MSPPLCTALAGLKCNGNVLTREWLNIDMWVDFRKWPWPAQSSTWMGAGSFFHRALLWHQPARCSLCRSSSGEVNIVHQADLSWLEAGRMQATDLATGGCYEQNGLSELVWRRCWEDYVGFKHVHNQCKQENEWNRNTDTFTVNRKHP